MIPNLYRRLIILVYTFIFLITYASYINNTIHFKDNWDCVQCRGENSHIVQQFLYFSIWSLYLTTASFIGWAFFTPRNNEQDALHPSTNNINGNHSGSNESSSSSIQNKIFNISLPVSCTVLVSNMFYIISTPPNEFVDTDLCYHLGTVYVHKDNENDAVVTFLLLIGLISDLTVHWLSAPLLLTLFYYKEIPFTGNIYYPWSTALFVVLATIVGLLQGPLDITTIYCSDNAVMALVSICIGTWMFHTLFVCLAAGKCTRCSLKNATQPDDSIMEEEGNKSKDDDDFEEDLPQSSLVDMQDENQGTQKDDEEV